ncbi:GNAT family N-acetyltransferase [Culicoidibacter larvae]|uniref:GNAT family N-acetyltransferase n=1 Tax=Culicoidibacter larvae TaxID=2579976 RepID=A0A5R8QCB1_9FIRM|nr:GNAT family N-acetyltransferase [Culicoidibacter larvae]TLG74211.1 GNAT family N-acetyltransferase [Culicoidibacter larvae]
MIRKATPQDAKKVAPLIYSASGETIRLFLGADFTIERAIAIIEQLFTLEDVFISYQYTLVFEENNTILGIAIAYPYNRIKLFDKNIEAWLAEHNYAKTQVFSTSEANADEFYLDSIAVDAAAQGRGIASLLFESVENLVRNSDLKILSLIVDINKNKAHQIYLNKGFSDADKRQLYGNEYYHMVKEIK